MVEYTCNKCFRIFDHKHNYLYHVNRKKSCAAAKEKLSKLMDRRPYLKKFMNETIQDVQKMLPENIVNIFDKKILDAPPDMIQEKILKPDGELGTLNIYNPEFIDPICVYCNRNFVTNSHRNRHMNNNCNVRKKYCEMIKVLESEFNNLYVENKFLRNKYMGLFGDGIFPFGTEKFGSVDINLIADAVKNPFKGIPDMVEFFHFSGKEKKYSNIRIKNPRSSHLEIFNGKTWIIETKENVIQTLIRTYIDLIDTEIDNLNSVLPPFMIRNYNDFTEYFDYYISYLMYDTDLTSVQKKYSKPVYQKIYSSMELMLINTFRKEIFLKIEEEIMQNKKNLPKIEEISE